MGRRRGSDILLDVLRTEGVEHVFGNPGTTELALIDALSRVGAPSYVLGLHESVCVGMADGYARANGRPSFVNLHTAAGLGNSMGVLSNVAATRTPMVVTAGQQDQRHLLAEPFLSGNLAPMAEGLVKRSCEVHRVEDLGPALRRAFRDSTAQPPGPVFVSMPMDLLTEESETEAPPRSHVDDRAVPGRLAMLASAIAETAPARLAVIAGDEVATSGAVPALVRLAETLGCAVFGAPMHSDLVFPFEHPQWCGALPADASAARQLLVRFDTVLAIGSRPFMTFMYRDAWPVPETVRLLHLSPSPHDIGRTYSAVLGLVGDPRATIEALLVQLEAMGLDRDDVDESRRESELLSSERRALARRRLGGPPEAASLTSGLHPSAVVEAIMDALGEEITVVDEGVSNDPYVRAFSKASRPGSFLYSRGGGLGWGVPAAMGVSLATGRSSVAAVVGDGSFLYSPQSLWTAVHEALPVVAIVLNNRGYLILKRLMSEAGAHPSPRSPSQPPVGLDITEPAVDLVALARGFGASALRVTSFGEIADAVRSAVSSRAPCLVEILLGAPAEA